MKSAGLEVQLRNLTSAVGIATIECTIAELEGPPHIVAPHAGCGTHPDARIALTRALTEAAQSRMTSIQGGREDLSDFAPAEPAAVVETPGDGGSTISFNDIASHQHESVNEDVEFMIERMRQSGFDQAVVFDITRAAVGIPVVRIVAPRAEAWPVYFMHGRASVGPRALQQIHAE